MCVGLSGEIEWWKGLFGRFEWATGGAEWGVGHVSGCGGLGIEVRKVRDGASKGQRSRAERWRFVVGNGAFVRWRGKAWIVNGWLSGGCNDALRMAYLDAGRGETEKTV